jgi:hypothetical protein
MWALLFSTLSVIPKGRYKVKKMMFVVLAIIAMIASVAAAPMQAASVTLISVTNGGGGPTFTFRVDGPVNLNNGIVHSVVGEYLGDFPLSCVQQDATTVVCYGPRKISGSNVTVEFGGTRSWVQIPEAQEPAHEAAQAPVYVAPQEPAQPGQPEQTGPVEPPTQYCYEYYSNSGLNWIYDGKACQDAPAVDKDPATYETVQYQFNAGTLPEDDNGNSPSSVYVAIPQ